jgi:pimeloyl-ACP methyl ester carboxylesterase
MIAFAVASTVTPSSPSAYPSGTPAGRAAHRFVHVHDARLHLLDFGGEGRAVVFLHGVGGNAWTWLEVAPALADTGRTLALDFRGYGESQWSPTQDYSTATHASDLAQVLDALGLDELDVVGFSWGGLVALALAAADERVRRVAMVDIPPSFEQSETAIPALAYGFVDAAAAVDAERRLSPRAAEETLAAYAALSTRPSEGGHLVKKHDEMFLFRWPFRRDDLWPELRALDRPVLVVRAAESPVLPKEVAARMVGEARDGAQVEIPDCGHMIPIERPVELTAALRAFLA